MSARRVRIHVDRLVLDGLPAGTTPKALEAALRAALAGELRGVQAGSNTRVERIALTSSASATPEAAAGLVAQGIGRAAAAGRRR
jgi:hypothetical protein